MTQFLVYRDVLVQIQWNLGRRINLKKIHEAEIYSKSNGIWGFGCKMRFINFDKIFTPSTNSQRSHSKQKP